MPIAPCIAVIVAAAPTVPSPFLHQSSVPSLAGAGAAQSALVREFLMLGKCVGVALSSVICLLLLGFEPSMVRANDTDPAEKPDAIENLAGRWQGEGTMIPTSGRNEQFRCIVTYTVAEEASRVRQHFRCQGVHRDFDAVTRMAIEEDKVTGVWADNVYSISGTLAGTVTDTGFDIQLRSAYFDAKMSVVSSDCQQTVKVVPNDRSGFMKELAATLKKC
jgi:hypothetical protein